MKVRIKKDACVLVDFHAIYWPDFDDESLTDLVFEVSTSPALSVAGSLKLRAPGYGGNPYGNGPIFAHKEDVEEVQE